MWNLKNDEEMFKEYFYEKVTYWMPLQLKAYNGALNQFVTHCKKPRKPYQGAKGE